MSATSCKTGTSCVFKLCPSAWWQGSGMERAVACREGHYVMYHHIRKDAPELHLYSYNFQGKQPSSCTIILRFTFLVPFPGTRLFHVRLLVPSYTNLHVVVELFPSPFILNNPVTCPRISGSQGLADELSQDVQKREFLDLYAKFEFT